MKVISLQELEVGDMVVVQTGEKQVKICKITNIDLENWSLNYEGSGLDICIDNPDEIVVLDDNY